MSEKFDEKQVVELRDEILKLFKQFEADSQKVTVKAAARRARKTGSAIGKLMAVYRKISAK